MNEESNADGRVLSTQRVLPFSSAEVFGAIEDPAQLAQWWGPDGFKNTVHRFNFVPGGEVGIHDAWAGWGGLQEHECFCGD